jgi:hypothetical protein
VTEIRRKLPGLVEGAFLSQFGQPSPEWRRREADAIVIITLDLLNEYTSQTLEISLAHSGEGPGS